MSAVVDGSLKIFTASIKMFRDGSQVTMSTGFPKVEIPTLFKDKSSINPSVAAGALTVPPPVTGWDVNKYANIVKIICQFTEDTGKIIKKINYMYPVPMVWLSINARYTYVNEFFRLGILYNASGYSPEFSPTC